MRSFLHQLSPLSELDSSTIIRCGVEPEEPIAWAAMLIEPNLQSWRQYHDSLILFRLTRRVQDPDSVETFHWKVSTSVMSASLVILSTQRVEQRCIVVAHRTSPPALVRNSQRMKTANLPGRRERPESRSSLIDSIFSLFSANFNLAALSHGNLHETRPGLFQQRF